MVEFMVDHFFWIWLASTAAIVIVPMILGALLVRKFNRDQEKGSFAGRGGILR